MRRGFWFLCLGLGLGLSACVDPNVYQPYRGYPQPRGGYASYPPPGQPTPPPTRGRPQEDFFAALSHYCGKAFAGRVVTNDAADSAMRKERLVLDVRQCSPNQIRMPFHQGANRSRIWVLSKARNALSLKHDHRAANGQPDKVTQYGGSTVDQGSVLRQEFPADSYSANLFQSIGNTDSVQNVWALEVIPGRTISYELKRPGRFLRIEFDVTRPLGKQPKPWGG